MPAHLIIALILLSGTSFILAADEAPTSHDPDIDRVRKELRTTPTTGETYRERSLLMFLWLSALQQQGADTHPFFEIDKRYYQLEGAVLNRQGPARNEALREMGKTIDAGFAKLEEVQHTLKKDGMIFQLFDGDPSTVPAGGDGCQLADVSRQHTEHWPQHCAWP